MIFTQPMPTQDNISQFFFKHHESNCLLNHTTYIKYFETIDFRRRKGEALTPQNGSRNTPVLSTCKKLTWSPRRRFVAGRPPVRPWWLRRGGRAWGWRRRGIPGRQPWLGRGESRRCGGPARAAKTASARPRRRRRRRRRSDGGAWEMPSWAAHLPTCEKTRFPDSRRARGYGRSRVRIPPLPLCFFTNVGKSRC